MDAQNLNAQSLRSKNLYLVYIPTDLWVLIPQAHMHTQAKWIFLLLAQFTEY